MIRVTYRPEQQVCPVCQSRIKRAYIVWRKQITFSTGEQMVTSWAYQCKKGDCPNRGETYRSIAAEKLHLRQRRFSRELIVRIGYHHFWQHQTMYEIHAWMTQDLHLQICERQVANLLIDFLALLGAAQPQQIRSKLKMHKTVFISIDGMQPEKGNDCLYIVRELQSGVTLLAKNLEESSQDNLCQQIFEPLKQLVKELGLNWGGVVSDAQETIRLAVASSLEHIPHQACQSHCLRDAGKLTFEADRASKTDIKASLRHAVARLRTRMQSLPNENPFRTVLLDYLAAIRSLLLVGGIAPFELGGILVFDALEDLDASILRCQKKATINYCAV
jgi:hypothetical protein